MAWRETWIDRAERLIAALGLDARSDVASDPFFGRGGNTARRQPARSAPQARDRRADRQRRAARPPIISLNYHQDHFGELFGIRTADGAVAHTACVGFGLERMTLALYRRHGFDRAMAAIRARGARPVMLRVWDLDPARLRASSPSPRRPRLARVELLRRSLGRTAPHRGRRAARGAALHARRRLRGRPVDVLQVPSRRPRRALRRRRLRAERLAAACRSTSTEQLGSGPARRSSRSMRSTCPTRRAPPIAPSTSRRRLAIQALDADAPAGSATSTTPATTS